VFEGALERVCKQVNNAPGGARGGVLTLRGTPSNSPRRAPSALGRYSSHTDLSSCLQYSRSPVTRCDPRMVLVSAPQHSGP
jgi:hypothetical protein